MKNLKISFRLESPLLINRFSTIDSILIHLYVQKHFGKNIPMEQLHDFDFLEKYADGYSGSIWYVKDSDPVLLENRSIVKKPEYEYLNAHRDNKIEYSMSSGEFKAYNLWFEVINVPEVYFYARGKKEIIEDLLKNLHFLGKKSAAGFGKISSYKIEVIEDDKSVFLAPNSPSRPISTKNHKINNSRIAYYNPRVPYWSNWTMESCYLPNSSLVEQPEIKTGCKEQVEDKYIKKYHSAINFVFDVLHKDKAHWQEIDIQTKALRADKILEDSETKHLCAFSGEEANSGILCKDINKTLGPTFTDYPSINPSRFISKQAFWTLQCGVNSRVGKNSLGFHLIDKSGIIYVMGKNKTKTIAAAIKEADLPFNLALKTTANNQHVVFKSKLTISKDLIACQYGNETYYFGLDEALECIKRVDEMVEKYPITKTHLIPSPQVSGTFAKLRQEAQNNEVIAAVSDFYKQYSKDVRAGAFLLGIGEK
ncbi:hypothetical protein ACHJH3_06950 [Campylobacter sp. MOP7]|uniref:hypothetical protein n=1 Tax=Campylobacter canis TaxID=3378588 RepID=UPI00387EE752